MKHKDNVHESTIQKILKKTAHLAGMSQDRKYFERQLRKIYSEQFGKTVNQKQYQLLFDQNREKIDQQLQEKSIIRLETMTKLQQKSIERRQKLLNDRIKTYHIHQRRWALKTEQIKQKVRRQQTSMRKVAEQYRQKVQHELNMRQTERKLYMKQFSQKYHRLFSSKVNTTRSKLQETQQFDQTRLNQLLKKRKNRIRTLNLSRKIDQTIKVHQTKENQLRESKSKEQLQKMINKFEKINSNEKRKLLLTKSQSIEKAKQKLYQKVYKNVKPQIGQPCYKQQNKQQRCKVKTVQSQFQTSRLRQSALRQSVLKSNQSIYEQIRRKNQQGWLEYCRKSRRIKISRVLKLNVKNAINTQFKNHHFKTSSNF